MKWCTVIVIFSCIWCVSCDDAASDVSTTPSANAPVHPAADAPVQPPFDGPDNNTSIEDSVEEMSQYETVGLKTDCLENANLEAFESAVVAPRNAAQCLESHINGTAIIAEMGVAKELKDFNAVFEKQCGFVPQLRECVGNFTAARGPCFNATYRVSYSKAYHDVLGGFLDSLCYNKGERLALFFANGGPACIEEQSEGILKCIRPTAAHLASGNKLSGFHLVVKLVKRAIDCISNYRELQTCVVGKLAVCRSPVIGSLVDSLLNDIHTVMPCANRTDSQG